MALSIFGHVIWHPKWDMDKKIGIAVSGAAAFTILVIVLTFFTIITIETKQKIALGLQNSTNETSSASKLGKY